MALRCRSARAGVRDVRAPYAFTPAPGGTTADVGGPARGGASTRSEPVTLPSHRAARPRLRPALAPLLVALATASLGSVACVSSGAPAQPTAAPTEAALPAVEVDDAKFAEELHRILTDGSGRPERQALLAGVVRRQLAHAAARFAAGSSDRGTASVLGALALLRVGEGRADMIAGDEAGRALAGAIERVSRRGDEGRAKALMLMRAAMLQPGTPERLAVEEHLAALDRWAKETRTGGPMQRVAAEQRAAVAHALVEPTQRALAAAEASIRVWIERGLEFNFDMHGPGPRPAREEAMEAARALESGAVTLAALYLRSGDGLAALEALERTGTRRTMRPVIYERLRAAAEGGGAREWLALAEVFEALLARQDDTEIGVDPHVARAALWGAALEAYRREPRDMQAALYVARELIGLGMSEATPLVVATALGEPPTQATLSAAMRAVAAAIQTDVEADDVEAARRTFRAAAPILAAADREDLRGLVQPPAFRLRFLAASLETRSGNLAGARPLLDAAVAAEPSVTGFTLLAVVERQAGNPARALEHVQRAVAAPDAREAQLDVAEAHMLAFEVHRDAGATDAAKEALRAGLAAVLAARQRMGTSGPEAARAERLLARVLDGYGDARGSARAIERALDAAEGDRAVLGATMLDAVGRALVRRDLAAARSALRRGIDADVPEEDLIYAGLWVMLLERELGAATDGTAERALRATNRGSWTGKLAAWASGRMSDTDLRTAAQNAAQRVEFDFYTAMTKRVAGDPAAQERLRAVAKSPVIDLLEVQIARELLAPRIHAELPGNVKIP